MSVGECEWVAASGVAEPAVECVSVACWRSGVRGNGFVRFCGSCVDGAAALCVVCDGKCVCCPLRVEHHVVREIKRSLIGEWSAASSRRSCAPSIEGVARPYECV